MPALPSFLIEPIWQQLAALLPEQRPPHPLAGHRPRIPDRIVFDKLVQILVFGCAYARIADERCSVTTIRRRRDEWIRLGAMARLEELVRSCYDRLIGLQLEDIAVDGCITKSPCGGEVAGRSPVDRGKGIKRSLVVDAAGIPLGIVLAAANQNDSPLLAPTLDTVTPLLEPGTTTAHLDRGYDSQKTRTALADRNLLPSIARVGMPAPIQAGQRWVVERTHAWHNAFKKLVWCTERRRAVVAFYVAFATVVIIVRRLIREGWRRYRWDGRPRRCP